MRWDILLNGKEVSAQSNQLISYTTEHETTPTDRLFHEENLIRTYIHPATWRQGIVASVKIHFQPNHWKAELFGFGADLIERNKFNYSLEYCTFSNSIATATPATHLKCSTSEREQSCKNFPFLQKLYNVIQLIVDARVQRLACVLVSERDGSSPFTHKNSCVLWKNPNFNPRNDVRMKWNRRQTSIKKESTEILPMFLQLLHIMSPLFHWWKASFYSSQFPPPRIQSYVKRLQSKLPSHLLFSQFPTLWKRITNPL